MEMNIVRAREIIEVIRTEGIPVKESSKGARFRCPFHDDKHPSAFAYRESNRFFCFGCGVRGDVADFVMKLKGLNFKEALAYLGMERIHAPYGRKKEDDRWRQKLALTRAFREWEKHYYDDLAAFYRVSHKVMKGLATMEAVEEFALLYQDLPLIEHKLDILLYGTDEDKYRLFKEVAGDL